MFLVYVLFLIFSGIMMLVMAFTWADYAKQRQVANFVLGTGFLIYGLYLLLVFQGGTYYTFYYVFILPVVMGYQFFRARSAAKARQREAASAPAGDSPQAANYPQADSYPQAGAPWAAGPDAGNTQGGGYGQLGGYQ